MTVQQPEVSEYFIHFTMDPPSITGLSAADQLVMEKKRFKIY